MMWRDEREIARKTKRPYLFLDNPNWMVREGLLKNVNVNYELLKELSKDDSIFIREALAKKFVLESLKDSNWRVRYSAIHNNIDLSKEVLEEIVNDNDVRVRNEAIKLLDIQKEYIHRKNYDNFITIKLVVPGTCNANCRFCYNKHIDAMKVCSKEDKEEWLERFLISLEIVMLKIGFDAKVSLDITGNEPTLDFDFFIKIMHKLRNFPLKNKITRITCTTNGINLKKVAPYMIGVVDYVNISVHDYDQTRRNNIFGTYNPKDSDYRDMIKILLDNGIKATAISVIHNEIYNFKDWRDSFIKWSENIGFVSLRFRHNVYSDEKKFLDYMMQTVQEEKFYVMEQDATPDSTWYILSTKSGFLLYFLKGVIDTYNVSPGIEFVIHDDGLAYADFNKNTPFDEYKFPIGLIFDKIV